MYWRLTQQLTSPDSSRQGWFAGPRGMAYAGAMASTEAPPFWRHAAAQPRRAY